MNLSKNFTLQELTKSDTAVRKGIDNNPNSDQIAKLQLLCENILQPVRDHFGTVVVTSGYRSPQLSVAIGVTEKPRKQFLHAFKEEGKTKYKPIIGKAVDL
jgi:uncharacterized protein YcbK (DUF882 family)